MNCSQDFGGIKVLVGAHRLLGNPGVLNTQGPLLNGEDLKKKIHIFLHIRLEVDFVNDP